MATLQRRNDFPHLLLITGNDIVVPSSDPRFDDLVGDWRARVKTLLFSDTNGVRNFRGEVDFILCYVHRGAAADHAGVDHTISGRPLRGIIRFPGWDLDPADGNFDGHLSGGIGHEVGHYWLIPGGAQVITPNGPVATPTPADIADSLNRGNGLPPFAFMGRQDAHWSPFIDSRNSPMDGINHSAPQPGLESLYGYAFAVGERTSGVSFDLPGFRQVTTRSRYSDFELFLMGVLGPPAFAPSEAFLNVLQARWVHLLPFQAGLFVELSTGQKCYVGFDRGPHQLRAQTIDGSISTPAPLRAPFNPGDLVAARAVQRGNHVFIQVRFWKAPDPLEGCLYEVARRLGIIPFVRPRTRTQLTCSDVLGDVGAGDPPNAMDPYLGWTTLSTINGRATRVGIGARHFPEGACFARLRATLCKGSGGSPASLPLAQLSGTNLQNQTSPFSQTLLSDGTFVLPYNVPARLEHSNVVDLAPRLTEATSAGDFAYGAWLKLEECIVVPHAGGAGVGKTYIGRREHLRFDHFDFAGAWGNTAAVRQAAPPQNTYKFLFCLLSQNQIPEATVLPKLNRLDLNRRGWELAFNAMTQGQRFAGTSIP